MFKTQFFIEIKHVTKFNQLYTLKLLVINYFKLSNYKHKTSLMVANEFKIVEIIFSQAADRLKILPQKF